MAADMRVETIKQSVPEIKGAVEVQAGCFKVTAPGQTGFYVNKIELYSVKDPGQYFSTIKLVSNLNGKQVILGEVQGLDARKVKDNDFRLDFPKMSLPVARGQYKNICIVVKGLAGITTDADFSFVILKNGLRSIDAKKKYAYASKQLMPIQIKVKGMKTEEPKKSGDNPPFYSVTSETKVNHNLAVSDTADASIQIQLTSKGGDIYIPTNGAVSARALRVDWTETSSTMAYSMSADMQGDNYVLHDGDTKAMTVLVHIEPYATGYYYSQVDSIGWKNEPSASTLNLLNYQGISQEYKSSQVYLIKR